MPLSLLIAIFLAFGLELGPGSTIGSGPLAPGELNRRLAAAAAGVALVGVVARLLGEGIALSVSWRGGVSARVRRWYAAASRAVDWLALVIFGWIIHGLGWAEAVERGLGLRGAILADEAVMLLPFLLAMLLGWWGLYPAERLLRPHRLRGGLTGYLVLRARQALGLVLPVALIFSLGQDVLGRRWPAAAQSDWVQFGSMSALGALVLVLAPAFVRLSWPTQPLPAGPLRHRLERLARRYRFRCTDILIWDTGQGLVNAGVTGALPWFRYVLLTDALVESLDEQQVEAVFGHEIGHIAHRHLAYFGLFLLGSVGVMALVGEAVSYSLQIPSLASGWAYAAGAGARVQPTLIVLACLVLYFLPVFGFLSRRFERQADVFGCRAVSCGRPGCPPHADLNGAAPDATSAGGPTAQALCPAGIRIFASALARVAALNGMDRNSRWAWRHGSIARRIAFLEGLEGHPEAERDFQRQIRRLRVGVAVLLTVAVVLAAATGSLARLP